jgi:hypothetical protein
VKVCQPYLQAHRHGAQPRGAVAAVGIPPASPPPAAPPTVRKGPCLELSRTTTGDTRHHRSGETLPSPRTTRTHRDDFAIFRLCFIFVQVLQYTSTRILYTRAEVEGLKELEATAVAVKEVAISRLVSMTA